MNKENQLISPHTPVQDDSLTPQQKARISAKFRAAKALLARKKPRISSPPLLPRIPNLFDSNCSFEVRTHERVPLKELQTNSGSLPASRVSDQRDNTYVGVSSLSCNFTDRLKDSSIKSQRDGQIKDENVSTPINVQVQRSESFRVSDQRDNTYVGVPSLLCNFTDRLIDSSITNPRDGQIKDENVSTPINAQVRRSESLNLNNCTPVSSVLDEDFDSSIFEEIDLLCNESFVKQCHKEDANSLCDGSSVKFEPVKFELDDGSNSNTRLSSHTRLENLCTEVDIIAAKELSGLPESYLKYLESLNKDQLEAASTDASTPLMVVAGPGSGKTSTMVGRVLMLLNQGIGPSHILALTFTTAAASEMRDRVGAIAGKEVAKALTMSTFHSFSLQLCRAHADKLGRTSEFLIYGHGQQRRAVIEAVRIAESKRCVESVHNCDLIPASGDASIQDFKDKSQKWQKFVTQAKASGKKPEECFQKGDEFGGKVLSDYNDILKSCNALDYHDLISCSVDLLTNYPEVREECQGLWKAIIVDEFQDTSSMQYDLLGLLVSHGQITIVGDDDQSIFSFNGANISGFDSFCKDFPCHKEVRLKKNYRSTRCIVEAAASLIQHNVKRCQLKQVLTDNVFGSKITVKECSTEVAQCSYVVDKVLETVLNSSDKNGSFGDIAILYRRQVSGRIFQATFRDRKIPFNVHGVAFYRKKVIKAIMATVKTTLPKCDDGPFRQAFKTFLPYEKEEKKKIIEHIDKISTVRKCSFISAASDIFSAKISGTFKRNQLSQGRKVLLTLEMISKLVYREQSISSVITSIAKFLPQKYLLQQQAVISIDGGKLLNEDNDVRSVLAYLLDDVTDFLSSHFVPTHTVGEDVVENKGCIPVLQAFVDYISEREKENFKSRRQDNQDSVTLTTIHQSKGLEWDIVFIVKANDSEIPLLHEHNGITKERGNSLEEERRLLYVAMTRARKKLFILYVTMDSNWQVVHPSRFLREIPAHLLESQADMSLVENKNKSVRVHSDDHLREAVTGNHPPNKTDEASEDLRSIEASSANGFLKKFDVEDRGLISRLFHQWAKKKAFQDPKRLLDKVNFVIDERLQTKKANKDILVALKSFLKCDEAFQFADHVIKWQQTPADKRVHLSRERQEHFQKLRMENAMGSSSATSKQIGYLHKLGCTVVPESKLHASRLIEQYKTL